MDELLASSDAHNALQAETQRNSNPELSNLFRSLSVSEFPLKGFSEARPENQSSNNNNSGAILNDPELFKLFGSLSLSDCFEVEKKSDERARHTINSRELHPPGEAPIQDYDVCNPSYKKDVGIDHPQNLTNHASTSDHDTQNNEATQPFCPSQITPMNFLVRRMNDLLLHLSLCRSSHCPYPKCGMLIGDYLHFIQCKTSASGGCVPCNKMLFLLQVHTRTCRESECHIPCCRDLKEHRRRLQQQLKSCNSQQRAMDNDVCNAFYKNDRGFGHPHYSTNHASTSDRDTKKDYARHQLSKIIDLQVHVSQCHSLHCQYPTCRKAKVYFRHTKQCKQEESGGCIRCKKTRLLMLEFEHATKWTAMQHAAEISRQLGRLQQHLRRRAVSLKLKKQRAAGLDGNSC